MKIEQLDIKNFRSIKQEKIMLDGLTIFVGPNGCGKSNFLKALQYFYEPKIRVTKDDFFARSIDSSIEIEILYGDLTQNEIEHFSKYLSSDKKLSVIKRFSSVDNTGTYYGQTKGCSAFRKVDRKPVDTFKKQFADLRLLPEFSDLPDVKTGPTMEDAFSAWETNNPEKLSLIESETQFFGFENSSVSSLEKFTKFVYIPAVMSENHLTDTRNSPIAELTDILARHKLKEDAEIKALQEEIKTKFINRLRPFNTGEMNILSQGITKAMKAYYSDVDISIYLDEETADVTLPVPKAIVNVKEGGYDTILSSSGQGLQRAFVLSLLQYFAEHRAGADEGTEPLNLILGIDEPELYQHPSKQKLFYSVLKALAETGSAVASTVQCCYTTHSPLMLNISDFNNIIRVTKILCGEVEMHETKIFKSSLSELSAREATLPSKGQAFTELKTLSGMINAVDSRINEGFFSKTVVLMEGPSDIVALRAASKFHSEGNFDLELHDIALISCGGKPNIEKPKIIFDDLGIRTYTVWDSDYKTWQDLEKAISKESITEGVEKTQASARRQSAEAAAKSSSDKNRDLLVLNNEVVCDWPEHVGPTSASFKDTIEDLLKRELGEEYLTMMVDKHNKAIQAKGPWKNPLVMKNVLEEAFNSGKRSESLEKMVLNIITLNSQR
ncbi:ATP-dependent nuclease [Pedobacter hartonius]|uniref:Predicted ATP-dependent endonuclease of the OLD family, contains P-loop ATPase and TOPRIM domains n=1 Tax=Pedobacter hartonius TaxID=425514 RepID=A0A1H4HJA4_9SPHI|nr:AAA family ATPase [Pedobacter hartonius]SEB21903.1 Predicted ATP-dependent endonuclease of the OLD family, contains P-loop ATPase and TOPRIM domains [Pedobacter hartonius]